MSGATDFQTITTSISTAYRIAKALIETDKALEKAELKLKLADLMVALADARTQVSEMQDQAYRRADELADIRKKMAFAGTMVYTAPYYFNTADGKRDGPFCATCWDSRDKLAVRLYEAVTGFWRCNTCKAEVRDANYRWPSMGG